MTIFDHTQDTNGVELHRISQMVSIPEFVKQADEQHTLRPSSLPNTVYADQINRRYPCHSPASTWLSAVYFQQKRALYHPTEASLIEQRLQENAAVWGILHTVKSAVDQSVKSASASDADLPDSDFAVIWSDAANRRQRSVRMANPGEVKAAAAYLEAHHDTLTLAERHFVATRIMNKAAAYGIGLGDKDNYIERQAGRGLGDPNEIVHMIRQCATLAKNAELRAEITKLADFVEKKPHQALHFATSADLAQTVDNIDRTLRIKYSDTIRRPEDVIFSVTLKEAAELSGQIVTTISGTVYDRDDFKKIALEDIRDLFGNELAKEATSGVDVDTVKLATIVSTLPLPDAELFDRLAKTAGIVPVQKEEPERPAFDTRFGKLANHYREKSTAS